MSLPEGIDVSHNNGTVDFTAVRHGGARFVYIKATESTGYTDPTFTRNWDAARKAGLYVGAYHFGRANADGAAQARHFWSVAGPAYKAGKGVLPPVYDLETTDGEPASRVTSTALAFLSTLHSLSGRTPMVYASPAFIGDHTTRDERLAGYLLWLAAWTSKLPAAPQPWRHVTFWQYDGTGTDNDRFNGTQAQLDALAGAATEEDDMANVMVPLPDNYPYKDHKPGDLVPLSTYLEILGHQVFAIREVVQQDIVVDKQDAAKK